MATKRTGVTRPPIPEGADDLTRIEGITLPFARRLYAAGILTFGELAALTADEICTRLSSKAGITPTEIAEQDWAGQARALHETPTSQPLAEMPTTEPDVRAAQIEQGSQGTLPVVPPQSDHGDHERLAVITIRLELDENDAVSETQVTYARTGVDRKIQKRWRGWEAERLLRFIQEQVEKRHGVVQLAGDAPKPRSDRSPSIPPKTELEMLAHELVAVSDGDGKPVHVVEHVVRFSARLALDLARWPGMVSRPDSYAVTFRAKQFGSGEQVVLGEVRGSVPLENQLVATTTARSLRPGLYRLEALVGLETPQGSWPEQGSTLLQGELVLVD
jgi:hypothetical protein